MADIFGPRGTIKTTTAPAYGGSGVPGDTYAKGDADCALATTLEPDDWNFIIDNMRIAARGQGVPDSDVNDQTILSQAFILLEQRLSDIILKSPTYPEIETATNVLAITNNGNGTITVNSSQSWLWRGAVQISSDDFVSGDRTLSHAASKTYHLRWNATGTGNATPAATYPKGRFEIIDLTGASPSEDDAGYDTTYDRMLIAKIVTDGANSPTITALANANELPVNEKEFSNSLTNSGANGAQMTFYPVWNLSRAPNVQAALEYTTITPGSDEDMNITLSAVTRFGATLAISRDHATGLGATIVGRA